MTTTVYQIRFRDDCRSLLLDGPTDDNGFNQMLLKLEPDGSPKGASWAAPPVLVEDPAAPEADFVSLYAHLVCTGRAVTKLGTFLDQSGELLPLRSAEPFFLFNCLVSGDDALDEVASGLEGVDLELPERLVFKPELVPVGRLFMLPEVSGYLYCAEGFLPPDQEFKSLVERSELRGLRFVKAWDADRGTYSLPFP